MVAYCYEHGKGVTTNLAAAAKLYRMAAEFDMNAQFALGYCYELGRGVGQEIAQAKHWYAKAADLGHKRAANALARLNLPPGKAPMPELATEKGYWVIAPVGADDPERWQEVWDFDLANNVISIGWNWLDDISCLDKEALRAAIDRTHTEDSPAAKGMYFRMLWDFFHSIKLGDVIVARYGTKKLAAVGTVTRTAYYDPNKCLEGIGDWITFAYHLDVRWEDSPRGKTYTKIVFGMQTAHGISEAKYRELVSGEVSTETAEGPDESGGEEDGAAEPTDSRPIHGRRLKSLQVLLQ